jgi:hypothetical protein
VINRPSKTDERQTNNISFGATGVAVFSRIFRKWTDGTNGTLKHLIEIYAMR